MTTPAVAAAFAAAFAIANQPIASASSNQNNNNSNQHPSFASSSEGEAESSARSGFARTYTPARGHGSRDGRGRDEVGMNDVGNMNQGGRSKQAAKLGNHKGPYPMGERVGFRLVAFSFHSRQTKIKSLLPANQALQLVEQSSWSV